MTGIRSNGWIWPAQALLLDSVTENAVIKGRTVFQKPVASQHFCRATAAIALYVLQTYPPQGGAGNKVGLRGGTPMTLLVQPGGVSMLWHMLWANVPQGRRPAAHDLARVFPWLAPTRSNRTHAVTIPADVHPLQVFWAMPRRIRLTCVDNTDAAPCDLTGSPDTVLVTAWRQEGGGPEYAGWKHPLSAYRQASTGGAWTAVRGSSDVSYRQWAGWVFGDPTQSNQRPARGITDWGLRVADLPTEVQQQSRILVTGFVSSEGSVVDSIESEMPRLGFDRDTQPVAAALAHTLVRAITLASNALSYAVAQTVRSRSFSAAVLVAACWRETEFDFYRLLRSIQPGASHEQALNAVAPKWLQCLRTAATRLFQTAFPIVPGSPNATHVAQQWRWLRDTFNGFTPSGQRLFNALQLPLPDKPTALKEQANV